MTFFREVPIEGRKDVFHIGWGSNRVRICDDDWSNHRWFEHPVLGQSVDVAALKLDRIPDEIMPRIIPANRINDFNGKISPQVTQDVYVIGYPIGLIDECPIPIWKRGTIAAEPLLNPGGSKKVFIDTATRKGMSGSLVIAKFEGFGSYEKMDGTQSNTLMWRGQKVFGIYSGRLGAHESMAQLGIVWKREVIDEVVNGAKSPS